MMLELFDQMVRERSGGAMADWLRRDPLPNPAFVFERIGEEGHALVARRVLAGDAPRGLLADVARLVTRTPHAIKRRLLALLLGEGGLQALDIGQFRLGGEVHQWMYDRFSLARLLREAGFVDPMPLEAATSAIPNWQAYHLDTCQDGTVVKPDLIFLWRPEPKAPERPDTGHTRNLRRRGLLPRNAPKCSATPRARRWRSIDHPRQTLEYR
ncbi:MAG: methyltransferase type 11 [Chromatiaceae bacterium]|nr:methyltransferase type 11 [Chromatiaceae bacterium]